MSSFTRGLPNRLDPTKTIRNKTIKKRSERDDTTQE